jgi:hypothetical protein
VLEVEAEEQVAVVGEGHALGEFVIVLVVVIVTELAAHVLAAAVTVLTEVIVEMGNSSKMEARWLS